MNRVLLFSDSPFLFGRHTVPRLGNFADRMITPQDFDSSSKEGMFRSWIPIPQGFKGMAQILLPNAFIQGGTLFGGNGGATTFSGSIEYKSGMRQQMLFGGSASGSYATPNIVTVDPMYIDVSTMDGGLYVNIHVANPNGVPRSIATIGSSRLGDGAVFSPTTTPDLTMSGTVAFVSGYTYRPCAMIGSTTMKSVIYIDDSIGKGQGPSGPDALGHNGIIERVLAQELAGINMSSPGAKAQDLAALSANSGFGVLWQYNTIAQIGAGTNDIFLGARTDAQVIADTNTLTGRLSNAGLSVFSRTILPRTSGGAVQAQEPYRISLNNALRGNGLQNVKGVWDITQEVENSLNGGLWALPGYTVDEIHPSTSGSEVIHHSGRINISYARR